MRLEQAFPRGLEKRGLREKLVLLKGLYRFRVMKRILTFCSLDGRHGISICS